jgi:hypothetical protein
MPVAKRLILLDRGQMGNVELIDEVITQYENVQ